MGLIVTALGSCEEEASRLLRACGRGCGAADIAAGCAVGSGFGGLTGARFGRNTSIQTDRNTSIQTDKQTNRKTERKRIQVSRKAGRRRGKANK